MAKKVLVVEDEKILAEVLQKKLVHEGYEIESASDGEEALDKIKNGKPDLVLLDFLLPRMDGIEVLEAMRKDKTMKPIPVIVISNSGQRVEIDKALELGVKDYLVKTNFDPKEIVAKVNKQLQGIPPGTTGGPRGVSAHDEDVVKQRGKKDKKLVLIVEDDKFLRDLIVQKLKKSGFLVIEALDGEEGVRKIQDEKPDLVLLDLILPGIDGFEVLERVKKDAVLQHIPIIILSNLGQKDDIERGIQLGARDYLIKAHFTPGEIIEKIQQY